MDDLATRIADTLEMVATRIRAMTVDRVARIVTIISLGIVAATLVIVALIFATIAIFRLVAIATSVTWAYTIFGGLSTAVGAFLWWKRTRPRVPADTIEGRNHG